jgi:hypothetical protein
VGYFYASELVSIVDIQTVGGLAGAATGSVVRLLLGILSPE